MQYMHEVEGKSSLAPPHLTGDMPRQYDRMNSFAMSMFAKL
jgi:hypothetical protein